MKDDRPNPLRDRTGPNPFADERQSAATDEPATPFSTATDSRPVEVEYSLTSPHRGGRLLTWSLFVLLLTPSGILCSGAPGLLTAILAFVIAANARQDLLVMRRGGMDPTGRTATRYALWLSLLALVLASGFFAWWAAVFDWSQLV